MELNPNDPLNRCCPYTGEQISISRLFSREVEIEHILPFSRTLDDSLNNKTVAMVRANRDKGDRTPYEAFGHSPNGYDYAGILERGHFMPKGKGYRFAPDGYAHWLRSDQDFLARALNDTAHISRIAKEYLQLICPGEVWVVPGRLTGQLRRKWELNNILHDSAEKNRADHRHHAIDAVIIGFKDRATLQQFAKASGQGKDLTTQLKSAPRLTPIKDSSARSTCAVSSPPTDRPASAATRPPAWPQRSSAGGRRSRGSSSSASPTPGPRATTASSSRSNASHAGSATRQTTNGA